MDFNVNTKTICDFVNRSNGLFSQGKYLEAFVDLEMAASTALSTIGFYMANKDLAFRYMDMAKALTPENWVTQSNYANICCRFNEWEKGLESGRIACELSNWKQSDCIVNYGATLRFLGFIKEAIELYKNNINLENSDMLKSNYGHDLLLLKQFEEGWKQYEYRKGMTNYRNRFLLKDWNGKPTYQTLIMLAEQGAGDCIQMARFFPEVIKRCPDVVVEVRQALIELLSYNFQEIAFFKSIDDPEKNDVGLAISSLPFVLKLNTEEQLYSGPYIKAPNRFNKLSEDLKKEKRLKIGICHAGSKGYEADQYRSCFIKKFEPITKLDATIVSLAKYVGRRIWGEHQFDLSHEISTMNLINAESYINDYADTASIIDTLDLVITVDTSIAHLSAAMGKPTWIILPFICDWRWSNEGNKSYWYDSVKLYRMEKVNDWDNIIEKIVHDLTQDFFQIPTN